MTLKINDVQHLMAMRLKPKKSIRELLTDADILNTRLSG